MGQIWKKGISDTVSQTKCKGLYNLTVVEIPVAGQNAPDNKQHTARCAPACARDRSSCETNSECSLLQSRQQSLHPTDLSIPRLNNSWRTLGRMDLCLFIDLQCTYIYIQYTMVYRYIVSTHTHTTHTHTNSSSDSRTSPTSNCVTRL